jgi:D-arabinan exo alpha-(1,3)/(1,5)-arabinofuranosidase (non-reducing end)
MSNPQHADTPPVIPVAIDAYRQWQQWPLQRIGVRAYLRSTYDRTGHNRTADASHYLYQVAEDFNVALDVEGAGVLYFVRTNRWHGSPWHYEIDDADHIVAESTTADPTKPLDHAQFVPRGPFPSPLTYTYATTHGADLSWVPMPFERRLRLAHSRTFYGTGYYIYHQFVPGLTLSRPLAAWQPSRVPDAAVLSLLANAGTDQAPVAGTISVNGSYELSADATTQLIELRGAPRTICYFELTTDLGRAPDLAGARLQITWDDRAWPSVDAPLALLFGAGTLHNPLRREWLVKALPMAIRFSTDEVQLVCQFPMPFFRSARIALSAAHRGAPIRGRWSLRHLPYDGPWNHVGYFHATYRDHVEPTLGEDLVFLDTEGVEGEPLWSGCVVGTSFVFTDRNVLTTLEGDPRFFFDDSRTPQAQGTGTEEWGGGGDYWGGRTMTLPLVGHPVGVVDSAMAQSPHDSIHSAYRFLLADLLPFGRRARIQFEHGGENESTEHYRSVTHWYGLPSASLVLTDTLTIGDAQSEHHHGYRSPLACAPYPITSRYELGPDHLPRSIAHPLTAPKQHVDYAFEAPPGRYYLWLELRVGEGFGEVSVWLEVDADIGAARIRPEYMGQMGFRNIGRMPGALRFQTATAAVSQVEIRPRDTHRLRIQPRVGQCVVGRVLLTPTRRERPRPDFTPLPGEVLLTQRDVVRSAGFEFIAQPQMALELRDPPEQVEIYPAQTLLARRTHGASEFQLTVRPDNHGVLLRRTLDYQFAHQRASVAVATPAGWIDAGYWYTAGSSTVYHSFPVFDGELGASRPRVITSNRRFRDDEFLLGAPLTRGRSEIRLRLEHAPRNPPLLPDRPADPTAWTELAYRAYCFVMPRLELN